jgi:hypothetical protein
MEVLIIILIFLTGCNLFLFYRISKQLDTISKIQDDHNVTLVRLVYHRAKEIEDYESLDKITKAMPKDFNYFKFL